MASNCVFTPNPNVTGFVYDIVCQAPPAANQLQTVYRADAKPSMAPSGYGAMLATRFYHGELVNNIGQ